MRSEAQEDDEPSTGAARASWQPPVEKLFPHLHETLTRQVDALGDGIGGLTFVTGEAGIGKAWLASALRRLHVGTTLVGRGSPATRELTLWPFRQAMARHRPDDGPDPFTDVAHLVAALEELAAAEPVVLVLEGLHLADTATLAAVEALADLQGSIPILCVATAAPGPQTRAYDMMNVLLDHESAECVILQPVRKAAIRRLLADLVCPLEVADELERFVVDQANGLPRLAERLVRNALRRGAVVRSERRLLVRGDLRRALPPDITWQVSRALHDATPIERDVVLAAAVLGEPADAALLGAATDRDRDLCVDAMQRGVELGLLRWVGPSVVLRTGVARDVGLRFLMTRTDPSVLDRVADGASLRSGGTQGFDQAVTTLASLGMVDAADRYRLRVAERAITDGRPVVARAQLDAVTTADDPQSERGAAHLELSLRLAAQVGASPSSVTAVHERLVAARPSAARASALLAARAMAFDDPARAVALLPPSMPDGASTAWAALLRALAAPVAAREELVEPLAFGWADETAPAACAAARHLAALRLPHGAPPSKELLERIRILAGGRGDELETARAAAALAQIDVLAGSLPHQLGSLAIAMSENGDRVCAATFLVEAALAHAWAGEPAKAATLVVHGFHDASDAAAAISARALVARAAIAAVRGDVDDVAVLRGALDEAVATDELRPVRALELLLGDDLEAAWNELSVIDHVDDPGLASVAPGQWRWLDRVAPLIAVLLGKPMPPSPPAWGWTAAARGWDALTEASQRGRAGDAAAAERSFLKGDAALAPVPVQQLVARRLTCELAVRDGWASQVTEPVLRAALARATADGLQEIASRCRAILRAGGFAVPRYGSTSADVPVDLRANGVTAREMEVLRLLAGGATTAEAAASLFVSVATVKSHVAHAMHKLGYASRRELIDAVRREDPAITGV